jgi:hypothetical protein
LEKKRTVFILLFLVSTALRAQIEGILHDSILLFLCHKWQEKARFPDKLQIASSVEPMMYEVNKNGSFVKEYDKMTTQGTWIYDSDRNVVRLQIDDKTDFFVVLLNREELLLSAALQKGDKKGSDILVLLHQVD